MISWLAGLLDGWNMTQGWLLFKLLKKERAQDTFVVGD